MNRVPITTVIKSWLEADKQLSEKCSKENCEYHSDSAYQGYVSGFNDGVNSQLHNNIEKGDIVEAYRTLYSSGQFFGLVSEDDCVNFISNSQEYNFLAGALWMLNKLKN